ncbi:site-specific DNA-methyltransferase [Labrys portucalensis]|uniref:site-specific DNA-methyltransferase (adenine-specific) n=1 Tax=Labrys neptuniae TaxID=376174 RepID=A0ABV6ZJW5_9HYPH
MSEPQSFLGGRVVLHAGDCREAIKAIADASIDAVVTDPPYALVSIGKRFGKPNSAPAVHGKDGLYARASAGFMGKSWDTGEVAFDPEFWAEVLRVLKPGGHVVAFGGTRAYHRLACAIEDAGFEIRDQLAWAYGSGFPKNHDVSKGIDKRRDWTALPKLQGAIRTARLALDISQSEAARRAGLIGPGERLRGGGFLWFETGMRMPTREQWPALKSALRLGEEFDPSFEEAEREITGTVEEWSDRTNYALTSKDGYRRDKPATPEAEAWEGWGTALKPAWEPIAFARKRLDGTVAGNVLAHGTGAINIGACLIEGLGDDEDRWPANLLHDGSDEVVEAFGLYSSKAARFFYSAKADAHDRIGSKHPTVKPIDLMQWLCRLITPPGGVVLDPFAGTGTTGEAAFREGFSAVLIEREAEYCDDIARRMVLAEAGPATRKAESAKACFGMLDAGPLFSGVSVNSQRVSE